VEKVNGSAERVPPVIPQGSYRLRGSEQNWDWVVNLPAEALRSDFPKGQIVRSPFAAARAGIERLDRMMLVGADDTFYVEAVVLEPSALGCSVLVREIVELPGRRELVSGSDIPANLRIRQAGGDKGIVLERINANGTVHEVGSSKTHPEWANRPDLVRDYAKQYAKTIA
jgi:hypothetical protein